MHRLLNRLLHRLLVLLLLHRLLVLLLRYITALRLLVLRLHRLLMLNLPTINRVEVLSVLLTWFSIYIQMNSAILAHLNSCLLNLLLSEDTEADAARILTLLMAKYILLANPWLACSLTHSLLCRKNCGNSAAQNNFTHKLNKLIFLEISKFVLVLFFVYVGDECLENNRFYTFIKIMKASFV